MSKAHVDELLPAYALGSLDSDEYLLVSQHLAGCPQCQEALAAYEDVVAAMPLAVAEAEPTNSLRQKILDDVGATEAEPRGFKQQSSTSRFRSFLAATPAWGWAGLAIILLLVTSNILLWGQMESRPNPDTFMVFTLRGTENGPRAEGLLILDKDGDTGTLVVNELSPLDESQQYQLWLIAGEERTSGAVFSVSDRGYGRAYISLPESLSTYTGVGITIEPAGGSPGPTGPKVLGTDL